MTTDSEHQNVWAGRNCRYQVRFYFNRKGAKENAICPRSQSSISRVPIPPALETTLVTTSHPPLQDPQLQLSELNASPEAMKVFLAIGLLPICPSIGGSRTTQGGFQSSRKKMCTSCLHPAFSILSVLWPWQWSSHVLSTQISLQLL